MPWMRIDENAMDHPKFVALSANAWRLWCEGLSFCQKHLTDGVIGRGIIKGFRYYSPTSLKMLVTPLVPDKNACWHQDDAGNITVHDYLVWNDSRETVLKSRSEAQSRRRRYNERNASKDASSDASKASEKTPNVRSEVMYTGKDLPVKASSPPHARSSTGDPRIGLFVEKYQAFYAKYRKGAHYLINPQRDYPEAELLVANFDDERLEKLMIVWLTTDDPFAESGSRTLAQFRSKASWCDSRLREAGL